MQVRAGFFVVTEDFRISERQAIAMAKPNYARAFEVRRQVKRDAALGRALALGQALVFWERFSI
jgi:hypothetical protein